MLANQREKIVLIKRKDGWKREPLEKVQRDILNIQEWKIDVYYNEEFGEIKSTGEAPTNLAYILRSLGYFMENDYMDVDVQNWVKKFEQEMRDGKSMVQESRRKYDGVRN